MKRIAVSVLILVLIVSIGISGIQRTEAGTGEAGLIFVQIGDLHFNTSGGSTAYVDDAVDDLMNTTTIKNEWGTPEFAVDVGDFCGMTSLASEALGSWKDVWLEWAHLPVFAVPGNHDVRYSGNDGNPYVTPYTMNESGMPNMPSYALLKDGILFLFVGDYDGHMSVHPMQKLWVEYMLDKYSQYTTVIVHHQSLGATVYSSENYHHTHDGNWWWQIFHDNPQIKMYLNGHNHNWDLVKASSSSYLNGGTSWGHDVLFVQTSTFGSDWGSQKNTFAMTNISESAIKVRRWNAQTGAWDMATYTWTTTTTYDPSLPAYFIFGNILQDGETWSQPNFWLSDNITLSMVGLERSNWYENNGFHYVIDRASLSWCAVGNDSALNGNWDNANYASFLNIGTDSPITIDIPNLNLGYTSSETTLQTAMPKAIPGAVYNISVTLRTPAGSTSNAFTLTMQCADKSTDKINSVLSGSQTDILSSVTVPSTWKTFMRDYTVPNDPDAWFIKAKMKFLQSVDYDVKYFNITRKGTSDISENFTVNISGNTEINAGNLINFQHSNHFVDPAELADSNGNISVTPSIDGSRMGMVLFSLKNPVFTRNWALSINSIDGSSASITLRNDASMYANDFQLFPDG